MTYNSLSGKIALVTGASSQGIGREVALTLAKSGADIAIHARAQNDVTQELLNEIRGMNRRAELFLADLADPSAARRIVGETVVCFGRIDILVNNAATVLRRPAMETSDAEFLHLLNVNLISQFACAQEAAKHMLESKTERGRIVFVSSINQHVAVRDQMAYCASKGAVMQLGRCMALELAETGITVNLVTPGTIETDANRHLMQEADFKKLRTEPVPMKRLGAPSDVAELIKFVVGPTTDYITGASFVADGGLSLSAT